MHRDWVGDGCSGSGVGGLKFREKDFFGSNKPIGLPSLPVSKSTFETRLGFINFFVLEFFASTLLMLSSVYVPDREDDILKQYVPSLAIVAVTVGLKDRRYFCPDGTMMVTAVMVASGAYDTSDGYQFAELATRLFGQAIGVAVIFGGFVTPNRGLMKHGTMTFSHVSDYGTIPVIIEIDKINRPFCEFFGTFIEGITVSSMLMPLLKVGVDKVSDKLNSADKSVAKIEAMPPRNKDLWYAAISIGLMHYVLERVFRVTMNPIVTGMHALLENNPEICLRFIGQVYGLMFAVLYCMYFRPTDIVYRWLIEQPKLGV
jgi:hypothetical protein